MKFIVTSWMLAVLCWFGVANAQPSDQPTEGCAGVKTKLDKELGTR